MKKLFILFSVVANFSYAQDFIITKYNKDTIKCVISKIDTIQQDYYLKYLIFNKRDGKFSNQSSMNLSEIEIIKTENKEILNAFNTYYSLYKKIDNPNIINKNITAGDELRLGAKHQIAGLCLEIIGCGITAFGSYHQNGAEKDNFLIASGVGVSLIGLVYFIEGIGHINKAGIKLNNSVKLK